MFFVLIAGLTPGLVARLELNIQGAPGRSCDYFCFVFSQVDAVALLILEILDLQDKVNYAVSEREDKVTDVTMLTRMTGCTGMY